MPDANKFAALRERHYTFGPTCGLCVHAVIRPGSDWGECADSAYEHLKHIGERRISIHRLGSCPRFTRSAAELTKLGAHEEFAR